MSLHNPVTCFGAGNVLDKFVSLRPQHWEPLAVIYDDGAVSGFYKSASANVTRLKRIQKSSASFPFLHSLY
jgi:hypothetical protein